MVAEKPEPVVANKPERKAPPAPIVAERPEPAAPVVANEPERKAPPAPIVAEKPEPAAESAAAVAANTAEQFEPAPAAVTETPSSDTPRREAAAKVAALEPAPAAAIDFRAESPKSRTRFWLATSASVVAVASGATAVGLLVDSASAQQGLGTAQAQLARTDLVPESRAAWEAHSTSLNSAVQGDQVGAGVLGAVAVTTAVTAIVLWVQEASSK
jgi:hypothetical protein